jgi:hypothetical protein
VTIDDKRVVPPVSANGQGSMTAVLGAAFLTIALTAACDETLAQAGAQPDVVVFGDDNRMTGDVRGLARGKLSFNTDSTGTIAIEWEDVVQVVSAQRFEVWSASGERYFGTLVDPETSGTIIVDSGRGVTVLDVEHVVQLAKIEQTLLGGLDVDLSVGYTYSKASDITQLSLAWGVAHRRERRIAQANFTTNTSSSSDTEESRRIRLDTRFTRLQPNRWLWAGLAYFESNDELSLDLRSSIGGGRGRILRQTNSSRLVMLGGLVLTKEDVESVPQVENDSTVEGLLAVDLEWFRFDTPELDVTTRLTFFPNLTDTGRFRTNLDVDFRWEVFSDLFLGLSLYHSHDSDPLSDGTRNDYGVATSVGWEF